MSIVYLGLGSNLGNRAHHINDAIDALKKIGLIILKTSSITETEPVGGPIQRKYLNAVIKAHTVLPPLKLLKHLKSIEKEIGRIKTVVNGPRIIDIDILIYDKLNVKNEDLTIPHPRMYEREFVMHPLTEIEPKFASKKFAEI